MSSASARGTARPAPWLAGLEEVEPGEPVILWEDRGRDAARLADFPRLGAPEPDVDAAPPPAPPPEPEPEPEPVDPAVVEEEARRRGYEVGYEAGYTIGHREGWAAAEAEGAEAFSQVGQAAGTLESLAADLESRCAEAAVQVALRVAGRVVGREVALAPDGLVEAVRSAIATLRGAASVLVTVHPDDLPALSGGKALEGTREGLVRIQILADPELQRGGWRVDSRVGGVDGTLETRLAALAERLAQVDVLWADRPAADETGEDDASLG